MNQNNQRLLEIDALRGIAAVMVLLFHYTTRYEQLFQHLSPPLIQVPWGHLGVNLFFMISGFVIFMTIERARHPLDFVVSRFSRLYPTYWFAIAITFVTIVVFGLPGKAVTLPEAIMNGLMFHGLLGVHHVDAVYWTLEIELLFYIFMLLLWVTGLLRRPYVVLVGWLAICFAYAAVGLLSSITLPYLIKRIFILAYFPYFAIGMALYLYVSREKKTPHATFLMFALSLGLIVWSESLMSAIQALGFGALLYGAASGKLLFLRTKVIVWFGAISFPLYLLHENIGWTVILHVEQAGLNPNLAIVLAFTVAVALASFLHYLVEVPVMERIRQLYRSAKAARQANGFYRTRWVIGLTAILVFLMVGGKLGIGQPSPKVTALDKIVIPASTPEDCSVKDAPKPLVLLVLGQSNAGNHGESDMGQHTAIKVFYQGVCYEVGDPIPGATGEGGSIWSRLAVNINNRIAPRQVVLAPLAIESTTIAEWAEPGPLRDRLDSLIENLRIAGLMPNAVLWQQGEADTRLGTTREAYRKHFSSLVNRLREAGVSSPIFVARSTYCRGNGHGIIARTQMALPAEIPGVFAGPDMDNLAKYPRSDGCHLALEGLNAAAQTWNEILFSHSPML